jgi:hypothetical protein
MADQVIEMNYDEIQKVADDFMDDADKCRMIAKVLEGIITALKVVALIAPFVKKLIDWMEGIKNALEKLAKVDEEFNKDLIFAMKAHKKGDFAGMRRFGEGAV